MASSKKISVVITSRASYARTKSVLSAITHSPQLELHLIGAASLILEKYGNAVATIQNEGFAISEKIHMVVEGVSPIAMAKTVGLGVIELSSIFENAKPDMVVTIADRFETIATAIAATYLNIPVVHLQGGEITGSIDEKVRHAVTKFASLHMVSHPQARERLIRMGEDRSTVHITGCPSIDLAAQVQRSPDFGFDFYDKYGGIGPRIDLNRPFIIVMQHPVTTEYHQSRHQMEATLDAIEKLQIPTFLFWPNVDAGSDYIAKAIRVRREKNRLQFVHFFRNLDPEDFLRLLMRSSCIVGNSSVAIREGAYLGIPAVNIGTRQAFRERGPNVLDVAYHTDAIVQAIQTQINAGNYRSDSLYGDGKAAARIISILESVTPTVTKHFHD